MNATEMVVETIKQRLGLERLACAGCGEDVSPYEFEEVNRRPAHRDRPECIAKANERPPDELCEFCNRRIAEGEGANERGKPVHPGTCLANLRARYDKSPYRGC